MSLESQLSWSQEVAANDPDVFSVFKKRPQNVFCNVCSREMHPNKAASHVKSQFHMSNLDPLPSSSDDDSDASDVGRSRDYQGPSRHEARKIVTDFKPIIVHCPWRQQNVYCALCEREMAPHNANAHVNAMHPNMVTAKGDLRQDVPRPIVSLPVKVTLPSETERTNYTTLEVLRKDYGPHFIIDDPRKVDAFKCTLCRDVAALDGNAIREHARSDAHKERRREMEQASLRIAHEKLKRNAYHLRMSSRAYGGHGDRPDNAAMTRFQAQLKVDLPFAELPARLALLCCKEFPTRDELRQSRSDLICIARETLATCVPGWDPLAMAADALEENDNPTEQSVRLLHHFPYPDVCAHVRSLHRELLHLEEAVALIELHAYNKKQVLIRPHNSAVAGGGNRLGGQTRFEVDVPGVSENRPSVLRGDKLHIHADAGGVQSSTSRTYYAYVQFVNLDTIVFSVPPNFEFSPQMVYSIVFKPSRAQERKLHRAVQSVPNTAMLLRETTVRVCEGVGGAAFSTAFQPPINVLDSSFTPEAIANRKCGGAIRTLQSLNAEQQSFVRHVHSKTRLSVLWGPPGTGKTTTLVAAIIDTLLRGGGLGGTIAKRGASVRLLVCAPSNEAADLIAERVIANPEVNNLLSQGDFLLRLPSLSREPRTIPEVLLPFCPPVEGSVFSFPDVATIMRHKIVVTTLMTCDRLYSVGIGGEHFTHLFVDEAGHATEPLLTIALNTVRAGALGTGTKVVLAGDHKQLGPRITVPLFVDAQVNHSPLQRIYDDALMWQEVGVQLLQSYRSHPGIIHLINTCYNDTLKATVANVNTFRDFWKTALVRRFWNDHCRHHGFGFRFDRVPIPSQPILCVDHNCAESREADSPSWMNQHEVNTTVDIVFTLMSSKLINGMDEVAVITPYRKQVQKILDRFFSRMSASDELSKYLIRKDPRTGEILRRPRVPVKVTTVDAYQGREARVVIVSCVRSNMRAMLHDARFGLGFLSQPERANVALSRAKDLLIVIGNRRVLCTDSNWRNYFDKIDAMDEGVAMFTGASGGVSAVVKSEEFEDEEDAEEDINVILDGAFEEKGGAAREE